MLPVTIGCIIFNAIVSSIPSIFMQNVIAVIEKYFKHGTWQQAAGEIMGIVSILIVFYVSVIDCLFCLYAHDGNHH